MRNSRHYLAGYIFVMIWKMWSVFDIFDFNRASQTLPTDRGGRWLVTLLSDTDSKMQSFCLVTALKSIRKNKDRKLKLDYSWYIYVCVSSAERRFPGWNTRRRRLAHGKSCCMFIYDAVVMYMYLYMFIWRLWKYVKADDLHHWT